MPTYKEKRSDWLERMGGKDPNSIQQHIWKFMHSAASFWMLNEAITLASKDEEGMPMLNGTLFNLLQESSFRSQIMAIRAMVDHSDDTNSLYRLIKDMKKEQALFTRKAVIDELGVPYDYIKAQKEHYALARKMAGKKGVYEVPAHMDDEMSLEKHVYFDSLSGVSEENRSEDDTILVSVFEGWLERLDAEPKNILRHSNKFVAHLATSASRANLKPDEINISYGDLRKSQKIIIEVVSEVNILLEDSSMMILGWEAGDPLQYLEQPIVDPSKMTELRARWDKHRAEVNSWAGIT